MLKKALFFFLLVSSSAHGETINGPANLFLKIYDALSINGPAQLKLVRAGSLEVKGSLQFHKLDVSGNAEIDGSVSGDNGKFGKLTVVGSFDIDHVICEELHVQGAVKASFLDVHQDADLAGHIDIKQGRFHNLAITGDQAVLDDVSLENILMRKDKAQQTLILKGATVVRGDILFESGNGQVQVDSPQVQIKGTVKGATVNKSANSTHN